MDTKILSRSYLETLSSADLLALADDYGIDVPDDLNRRFLIGELLELAEESQQEKTDAIGIVDTDELPFVRTVPESYNETQIHIVLHNPVWAFVYWDIKESDRERLADAGTLLLRVSFFSDEHASQPEELFDIQVSLQDREQYVLLKAGKKWVRVELLAMFSDKDEDRLASSRKLALPIGSDLLTTALPGRAIALSPLQELSSLKAMLRNHYENHRQAFSA